MGITSGSLILLLFVIILFVQLLRSIYNSKASNISVTQDNDFQFSEILLVSATISGLLYLLFFAISQWVWSFNVHPDSSEFTPYVRVFTREHDGIESFVLYCLMFVSLSGTLFFASLILKFRKNRLVYLIALFLMMLITGYYFYNIGFLPPMPDIDPASIAMPIVLVLLSISLYFLYKKNTLLTKLVLVILITFAGVISISGVSMHDLSFILDPALRLKHGYKFTEIYFQYDIYLSLLALAWMKLNLSLGWFGYLSQFSYFLLFIGLFFFTNRFFKSKGLSVFFIISLMLVRFYAVPPSYPAFFQVSPLRLDLWLILLLILNKKNAHHWLLGIAIGLLIIFHRNMGLIYAGAYTQLIILLFILDLINLKKEQKVTTRSVSTLFIAHLKLNAKNILLIGTSIALCYILFHELFSESAEMYRKIGIGMMTISGNSFYWYVPVLVSCLGTFLFFYRNKLGSKYTTTGLFVVLLAIGNSMYFFGRSHENNILNISAILVLILFLLFDILLFSFSKKRLEIAILDAPGAGIPEERHTVKGRLYILLPVIFIFFVGYFYSNKIKINLTAQYNNMLAHKLTVSGNPAIQGDLPAIKRITNNSTKVYFLDFEYDFYYYYFGNYAPLGYYSPCASWVYKKDLLLFLQDLLDKGYYIVCNAQYMSILSEYLHALKYNQTYQQPFEQNYLIALKKENAPSLLPATPATLYHIAIKDSLGWMGMDYSVLNLNHDFTIEVLVKPSGKQGQDAMVINNILQKEVFKGFTFQQNSDSQNHYVFALCNGTQTIPRLYFQLENNRWNYVTFVVNKGFMKVYDNGRLLSELDSGVNSGLMPYANSDMPLTIGNQSNRQNRFSGHIREVKISSGNMNETEIINTGQRLDSELNNSK